MAGFGFKTLAFSRKQIVSPVGCQALQAWYHSHHRKKIRALKNLPSGHREEHRGIKI